MRHPGTYAGLTSDVQHLAYVLKDAEIASSTTPSGRSNSGCQCPFLNGTALLPTHRPPDHPGEMLLE